MASPTVELHGKNVSARNYARSLSHDEIFQRSEHQYKPMFVYPPENPLVFVKHGGPEKQAEADMQRLAYDWLDRSRQTHHNIFIPEIYFTFARCERTFIVMEFVNATTLYELMRESDEGYWTQHHPKYYGLVVEAIQLLYQMPVPRDAAPGPYTRSKRRIKHCLFKDQSAPIEYQTVEKLQDHLNEVARLAYRHEPCPPRVTLEKELTFCYTDFNDENFMFRTDHDGRLRLYIVDFEHASFLPPSFFAYAILHGNSRFPVRYWLEHNISVTLPRGNLEVMTRIFYLFQISVWMLGLTPSQVEQARSGAA